MEKSIESIWKEGFSQQDTLLAPKLNNLYSKKSIHFIDRFTRMFKINLVAIGIFAGILWIASLVAGIPWVGAYLSLLFLSLVAFGKPELDKLAQIDKTQSSFHYLVEFDSWLKGIIRLYTKIYKVFYPLFFLGLVGAVWVSGLGTVMLEKIIQKFPGIYLYQGVPVVWGATVVVMTVLLFIFGGKIYQLDMKLTYGNALRKLDEMLADIAELRS